MKRVLITNGDNLRALIFLWAVKDKRDVVLHVAAERWFSACFFSRFCKHKLINPNPKRHPAEFLKTILDYVKANKIDVLVPSNADELEVILKNRHLFPKTTHIPFVDFKTFALVKDKWNFFRLATSLKVPVPKTIKVAKEKDLENSILKFPVILKITRGAGSKGVLKAENKAELLKNYQKIRREYPLQEIILQEYILGQNCCLAAMCRKGAVLSIMAYKSERQFPIDHGTATSKISVFEPEMMEEAKKILKNLNWHGIAQFDLIRKDNKFYFLEMNPRLYTSMNVTVKSGLNYPYALCRLNDIRLPKSYRLGVRCRILMADKLVFLKSLFRKDRYPLIDYFRFKNTYIDDFSITDPLPSIPLFVKLLRGKLL